MKKPLLILLTASALLFADKIDVIDKNYERVTPAQSEKILSYSTVLKKVKSSVVNISIQKSIRQSGGVNPLLNDPFFRQFFHGFNNQVPKERVERSLGSGVIVTENGYIVTNNHVVEGSEKVIVNIPGSKKDYEAKIVGTDPKSDLAVIKIEGDNFNALEFYDSDKLDVGDVVFAIGNPFGVGETITSGIISAKNRNAVGINEYEDFIQTDAPINPGNSGGALVNSLGYLVGVNSAILTKSGGNNGIGFSIPSNMVARVANSLIEDGAYERAWLGVSIGTLTSELAEYYGRDYGVVLTSVKKGSPADIGGLKRGDLILKVEGKKIDTPSNLKNIIGSKNPNSVIKLKILRGNSEKTLSLKLGSLDHSGITGGEFVYKGLTLVNMTENLKVKNRYPVDIDGVVIVDIDRDSKAAETGLRAGDVIVQVESKEITDLSSFENATKSKEKKRFFIYRNGNIFVTLL